jgi:uncharacterized protein
MTPFTLPALPAELAWHIPPLEWSSQPPSGLTIRAGARTDWFTDPGGNPPSDNAPCALFTPPDASFLLSARISVPFVSAFDAGTFHVRIQPDLAAKLCFECSPQIQPMVVSVVTRGVSDDCNSVPIEGNQVYLRLARAPRTLAFHYSLDGKFWNFVRYFSLGTSSMPQVGFSAQSPTGQGCTAVFSEITYRPGTLSDNRSGE